MPYIITQATRKLSKLNKRIRAVPGGTSAGKTIGILEVLIDLAQRDKTPTITSIVSESLPHLKRGSMRDFLDILQQQEYFVDDRWNKSDFTYTFETKSKIEFFSADQPQKVRGPRRDRLFINEANNLPFETFEQLEIRTKDFVFLDWNPTNEFWYYTDVKEERDDVEELTLTYLDNQGLSQSIVASIEQRKNRKGWWQVYGLGQLGEVEGKIYKDWEIIDDVPVEAKRVRVGLDFGYSNDPTTIVDVFQWNGAYVLDEICYQKGLLNKPIADIIINNSGNTLVIADSSEPKSIEEIKQEEVIIIGAEKGPDSVRNGISVVQDQKIFVTKKSVNIIKEYRNYLWMTDKNGKILNEPEHEFSHTMDAIRYALVSLARPQRKAVHIHRKIIKPRTW